MSKTLATVALVCTLILSACGSSDPVAATPDVDAIHTAAAITVMAEYTQTAAAVTPTLPPTATETPAATQDPNQASLSPTTPPIPLEVSPTPLICDNAIYVADVNFPDGTQLTAGQDFVKTWKIKNTGTCTWGAGYSVIYAYGERMAGVAEPLPAAVIPGEEIEVSVRFKAPTVPGDYLSAWRMVNAGQSPFGEPFFVQIVVR